jgi:hypothetical protein
MDQTAGMGVIHRLANIEDAAEQATELEVVRCPLTRPSATLSRWARVDIVAVAGDTVAAGVPACLE